MAFDAPPRPSLLTGTSRQLSSTCLRRQWRSISCSQAMRDAGSCGRKIMPTPYCPTAGSVIFSLPHSRRKKVSGIWIRMPAPSPRATCRRQPRRGESGFRGRAALFDDVVAFCGLDVGHKAHAAGVISFLGRRDPVRPACTAPRLQYPTVTLRKTQTQATTIVTAPRSRITAPSRIAALIDAETV